MNIIERVSEGDVGNNQQMAEIRIDCFVDMYEMSKTEHDGGFSVFFEEKQQSPQWFRSRNKITLQAIRESDPYVLGNILKDMLKQLEHHIDKYER